MWEFLAQHIWVALALLVSLGSIGAWVALIAFGIPAALLLVRAASLLQSIVEFLKTPMGQALAIILIVMTAFVAGDLHRTRVDAEREKIAATAQAQREIEIKQALTSEAMQRIAEIRKQADDLQQQVTAYEHTLSTQNAAACRATGDDVRQLRKLN
jgi:fumarate reductase subunit D